MRMILGILVKGKGKMPYDYINDKVHELIDGLDFEFESFLDYLNKKHLLTANINETVDWPGFFVDFLDTNLIFQEDIRRIVDDIETFVDEQKDDAAEKTMESEDLVNRKEMEQDISKSRLICPSCSWGHIENVQCVGLVCSKCGRVFELREI